MPYAESNNKNCLIFFMHKYIFKGNYTVRNYQPNLQTPLALPFGNISITLEYIEKSTRNIVFCSDLGLAIVK